jgi:hypothetical protein
MALVETGRGTSSDITALTPRNKSSNNEGKSLEPPALWYQIPQIRC